MTAKKEEKVKSGFLRDDKGNNSTGRLMSLIVVTVFMLTWSVICFMDGELVSWGVTEMAIIGGALGIKPVSKFIEGRK